MEAIRQESRNSYHRLRSIEEDAEFVCEIAALFPDYPVIANERCGSWYIPLHKGHGHSVYFKSTDGHTGQWDFSLRRANLPLLETIERTHGCIIVDSTRKGKRIPDSLSKTVPIWCAVINRAAARLLQSAGLDTSTGWDESLYTLPSWISRSEHAQMESRLDTFVDKLLATPLAQSPLFLRLQKPLRPLWFTPSTRLYINDPPDYSSLPFFPVICLSASKMVPGSGRLQNGYWYVQGGADDHELWAKGLTPDLFWAHKDEILGNKSECDAVIKRLVATAKHQPEEALDVGGGSRQLYDYIGETGIAIGSRTSGKPPDCWKTFDTVVNCMELEYPDIQPERPDQAYLHLNIPEGKKGQNEFYASLPRALAFIKGRLRADQSHRILIHCAKGQDRSVGIALAALVAFFDEQGHLTSPPTIDKEMDFYQHARQVFDKAIASGDAVYYETTTDIVEEGGIEFEIRYAPALAKKPQSQAVEQTTERPNPFLPYNPALFVSETATHNILLNKFCVVPGHVLVVTKDFQPQTAPLLPPDLASAWYCLTNTSTPCVAYYNCGRLSGASQPHKHIQIIPMDPQARHRPPIAAVLDAIPEKKYCKYTKSQIYTLNTLPYINVVTLIEPTIMGKVTTIEDAGHYLSDIFFSLFDAMIQQIRESDLEKGEAFAIHDLSYNVIFTNEFMMMVPRGKDEYQVDGLMMGVNSLGFAGMLLVKNEQERTAVQSSVLKVLATVGIPQGSGETRDVHVDG
ncbi:hypothetical protein BZG36_00050 [Bifiguratus adelaidae]|uniref:Uncharacterized protein n=1 Tax=Bifiguratus adelaidae TaxID=1938954 RepID=A0A261Y8R9_9FUNG|nr:hypothetical protein BZG36_00050 [Bifiguratus adelaidae]